MAKLEDADISKVSIERCEGSNPLVLIEVGRWLLTLENAFSVHIYNFFKDGLWRNWLKRISLRN